MAEVLQGDHRVILHHEIDDIGRCPAVGAGESEGVRASGQATARLNDVGEEHALHWNVRRKGRIDRGGVADLGHRHLRLRQGLQILQRERLLLIHAGHVQPPLGDIDFQGAVVVQDKDVLFVQHIGTGSPSERGSASSDMLAIDPVALLPRC